MVKVIEVAGTPNPDALKFVVDRKIVATGAKSFDGPAAAQGDDLASAIFSLGPVHSVFYMDRFVTVTKTPAVDWDALRDKIVREIEEKARPASFAFPESEAPSDLPGRYLAASPVPRSVAERAVAPETPPGGPAGPASDDDVLGRIHAVLDESVRPALAGDGGGLDVIGYKDFVLTVHYQGACGSCASSTAGTLFAIQNLLQRMVDPRIEVVPA